MVARLASIAQRHQKVAGSSPAVVILHSYHSIFAFLEVICGARYELLRIQLHCRRQVQLVIMLV